MTRNRLIVLAIAVALAALIWGRVQGAAPRPALDLVASLDSADKRPAAGGEGLFAESRLSIAGDTRRAVFVRPTTRITWDLTLPNRGFLRTAMGIDPRAWNGGDGVQFRIAISVGKKFEPLMTRRLDPARVMADRAWVPVVIDLARFSGQQVHLVLATDPGGRDSENALAYWAAPAITLR